MRRNILFILLLFAAVTALSALQKPVFLIWYASLVADAEAAELLKVVTSGLSLDMTMAGYVCALPILFVIGSVWYGHKVWKRLCRWWVFLASAFVAICFAVNHSGKNLLKLKRAPVCVHYLDGLRVLFIEKNLCYSLAVLCCV